MHGFVRILPRTAALWMLVIIGAGAVQAQRPQTTVINDTASPVIVTVVNPPFPPLELNTIPAGQRSSIGAPAGSTLRILDAQTRQPVRDIPVTQTREVGLTSQPTRKLSPDVVTQPQPPGRQMAQRGKRQGTNVSLTAEGTLHLIIACDTDDPDLGEGFEVNQGVIRSMFIDSVASRSLRYYCPWGRGGDFSQKLTARNLLNEIDQIKVGPNDTLMVYLACHGFWDKNEDEHWFRFATDFDAGDDSGVLRKTIIQRIKARGVRLGMLVTDACTNYEKLPTVRVEGPAVLPPLETTAPLFQALFFDQEGFLDLSSSSPGQFTLYYNNYKNMKASDRPKIAGGEKVRQIPGSSETLMAYTMSLNSNTMRGGLFTESMRSLLEKNTNETFDWKQFTSLLRADVENRFDEENPDGQLKTAGGNIFQNGQTIAVGEFPKSLGAGDSPPDPTPAGGPATNKFGVTVVAAPVAGVTVKSVRPGSQAAKHGVNVGEVIYAINNQRVNSPEKLEEALAVAPATFRITIGTASFVVRP
ncbi:MAG: PDZ domain-containing protein [Planctomycetaceae bacterium]|nr:PDZ domain-containing protein [Planctomycetaceae bacterium]